MKLAVSVSQLATSRAISEPVVQLLLAVSYALRSVHDVNVILISALYQFQTLSWMHRVRVRAHVRVCVRARACDLSSKRRSLGTNLKTSVGRARPELKPTPNRTQYGLATNYQGYS